MIFAAATFLGAFLLFLVQPLIGRLLLPDFGGSAAVWTLCLLFFQVGLLAGYAYTHLLVLRARLPRAVGAHLGLLALGALVLPLGVPRLDDLDPTLAVLGALTLGVGAPYVLLAATAPLVQAWAARADRGRTPYRLYAWSNAGSLLALIAYPLLVQPNVGLRAQSWAWSIGYVVFVGLLALGGRRAAQAPPLPADEVADAGRTRGGEWALWIGLPALSTTLLVATSDRLTEDFSATPFLWVLPLGLFLLTYIIAFGRPQWIRRGVWLPLGVLALGAEWWAHHSGAKASIITQVIVHDAALFTLCLVLHGELVRRAPPPARLTGFYLGTAAGGALGGLLVGLVAPRLLPLRVELQVGLVATAATIVLILWRERRHVALRGEPAGVWVVPAALVVALGGALAYDVAQDQADVRATERGFFGVLRVREVPADHPLGPSRKLLHGRIMHGREFTDARAGQPISYYGPKSGITLALRWLEGRVDRRRLGVLGLGIGTVAALARCGEQVVFWEIDPLVERLAREWFTYLKPGCVDVQVRIDDGRLGVATAPERFDLLALDAFSGDAIPTHLLTREAIATYLAHLRPGGVLAANVSNRHVDLRPVLRDHAAHFGLRIAEVTSGAQTRGAIARARWVLLTAEPDLVDWIERQGELDLVPRPDRMVWTDDHAPLLPLLRALR